MRTFLPRLAKKKAFYTKSDLTHDKPVGEQCLQFATTEDTMGDSETSSIYSLPLEQ